MDIIKDLAKKHVIILSIIISIITLLLSSIFTWDDKPFMGLDKLAGDLLITVFSLAVIRILGIWDTAGFRIQGFGKGLVLGIPFILIGIAGAIIGNVGVDFKTLVPTSAFNMVLFTVNMFMVGVNEEISMRSLVLNGLLNHYDKTYKGILKAVFVSALIFGAIHIPNAFFMPPMTVAVQAINAAAAGTLFAAIFIRSGSIWPGIIIHMLVDWLALFIGQCFTGGASVLSVEMGISQGIMMILLGSTPPITISLFLLRKSKVE
ncbi:CPBP family intramembrane glutamic endopeptidase [Acetanaerobacterium elongatum]|uniref:CAAX protease self-immunity n=1 Tax=Acetanaerobacterium elongatum TaxID=258515 RepID=A0A1H0FHN9_9FIRM|nr:CPBP family intramembrane glutamic endopeptidase [Acetanaerobacterium elongatum]SDN94104.1 CAAX protease self-immunity [Acetanaerobacterium elongatum]